MYEKLEEGLQILGLDPSEVRSRGKYAGGERGAHAKYFNLLKLEKPPHKNHCICGHFISENCYIEFEGTLIVVGNICIKKYTPKHKRTCLTCGDFWKGSKNLICKPCRKKSQHKV
jgi:hypothetical protein